MRTFISNQRNGANAAATSLGQHHVFDAKLAQDIANEFKTQQLPAQHVFRTLPALPKNWKPFHSSLIDTVRVVLYVHHEPLARVMEGNPLMSRDGFKFYVRSPYTQAVAQVFRDRKSTRLNSSHSTLSRMPSSA